MAVRFMGGALAFAVVAGIWQLEGDGRTIKSAQEPFSLEVNIVLLQWRVRRANPTRLSDAWGLKGMRFHTQPVGKPGRRDYSRRDCRELPATSAIVYPLLTIADMTHTQDAMVVSQSQFIIETARSKKLPTMFGEVTAVTVGALVSYGVSYSDVGRLSAKYVQKVLTGRSPRSLPVESFSKPGLAVNLQTARDLGVTIPQSVLFRADRIIE